MHPGDPNRGPGRHGPRQRAGRARVVFAAKRDLVGVDLRATVDTDRALELYRARLKQLDDAGTEVRRRRSQLGKAMAAKADLYMGDRIVWTADPDRFYEVTGFDVSPAGEDRTGYVIGWPLTKSGNRVRNAAPKQIPIREVSRHLLQSVQIRV